MSTDENKATVKRYFEGDHDGRDNTEIWDEVCTPSMTLIASVFPQPVRGLDVLKPITRGMHDAMGGFGIVVDEMIGEGDRVAVRWTMSGTQNGPLPLPDGSTLPPTGRSFAVTGMSFMRLDDGKLAEERTEADWMGFMQQLGATPAG